MSPGVILQVFPGENAAICSGSVQLGLRTVGDSEAV